ncbi:MAG: hypothetical protein ABFD52_08940 [Acidobacteriota bacterium]
MNADLLRTRFMEIMQRHRGRANAIDRKRLLYELQCYEPTLDDRRFRDLYANLPVCTCQGGMFLPRTPAEVQEFREYITRGWGHELAHKRVKIVLAYYPHLTPASMTQQNLFERRKEESAAAIGGGDR